MKNKFYNCAISAFFLNMFMISLAYGAGAGGFKVEIPDAAVFGKGSAFVGEANSPAAIHYNPAGITQLKGDTYMSLGDATINPFAKHTSASGVETQARINTIHVPHFYATEDFGLDRFNFGIGTGSSFGSITDWAPDSSLRYVATRSEITNIDLNLVAAYEVLENLSVAVGYKATDSHVNKHKKLLQDAGAFADADFNLKGKDIGHGYTLSGHYRLNEKHGFGVQYKSEMQLRYRGETHLDGMLGTYAAVFGGDHFSIDTDVDLELPKSVIAGYSYRPSDRWVFNFDVEWTDWSSVEHEKLVYKDPLTVNQAAVLNTGNPVPRDWDNVWSFAIGAEHKLTDAIALRGGYYYHQNAIPDGTVDNAVADSNSHGITGGVGYDFTENVTLDLAYSALIFEKRDVNNTVGALFGGDIDGEYKQWISLGLATLTWKY
jgi:long-chain fatty acid transport protein